MAVVVAQVDDDDYDDASEISLDQNNQTVFFLCHFHNWFNNVLKKLDEKGEMNGL